MNNNNFPTHSLIPFFSIFLLLIALCLLNFPIMETLWRHSFDDGTYSHAFLIPFIVFYLFFELSRSGKLHFREKISVLSIVLLSLSGILLFITTNAQISLGYWLAILTLSASSLIVLFNFSWVIIFPVAYLAFIFPFWGLLIPLLQNLSVDAVTFIMSFTGIPTYVDEAFITIPAGVFEIADGCSGLRYFLVAFAISSLFIFLHIKSLKRAAIFFSFAILGALLTNWIRITVLIVIGEYTNMESSLVEDHNAFGWYIYTPFLLLLFKLGNTLADTDVFQNSNDAPPSAKPKFSMILVALTIMILSSTTIKSYLKNTQSNQNTNVIQTTGMSPTVYFYSRVEKKSLTIKGDSYQIFKFDGSDLDGKPSYYENNMLPEAHTLIRSEIMQGWNVHFAQSVSDKAIILFKYEIDNMTYTNLSAFKIAQIKKAMMNINDTKLHWVYLTCESNCDNTVSNFLKYNY